ncbi:MAG: YHS domain-containing protein [Chloroflexota bacterium]|nr:YHS domain-containing protein [Chloroflexota bacterium]
MVVEKDKAAHVAEYDGQSYHFCSVECRKEFESNPGKYKEANISL